MARHYEDDRDLPPWCECEHCDGERGRFVRLDYLRGWVCRACDDALDRMEREGAGRADHAGG